MEDKLHIGRARLGCDDLGLNQTSNWIVDVTWQKVFSAPERMQNRVTPRIKIRNHRSPVGPNRSNWTKKQVLQVDTSFIAWKRGTRPNLSASLQKTPSIVMTDSGAAVWVRVKCLFWKLLPHLATRSFSPRFQSLAAMRVHQTARF